MKIKLNKTTSSGKDLWVEITNVLEITTGNTVKYIEDSFINQQGSPLAICKWRIVDENNTNIIPPVSDNSEFMNGQLPSDLYDIWNKTEENFAELMAQYINSTIVSNIID
jgi:hypothetical protein